MERGDVADQHGHRAPRAGSKAKKKEEKRRRKSGALTKKEKNHKAFGVHKAGRANREVQRNLDRAHRRHHVAIVDRTPQQPAPYVVAVVGPPGSGKSTLIKVRCRERAARVSPPPVIRGPTRHAQSLVKKYTKFSLVDARGPITVVSGKNRRLTFFECPTTATAMLVRSALPLAAALSPLTQHGRRT